MNLKGNLDQIGLAEVFKTLSAQNTTGLLSVTSQMGEKLIALSHTELIVFSDPLIESPKFGEVLQTRGYISETQMAEALMEQKKSETPVRLGDMFVKLKFITADKIVEILKFQIQEELWDLFTWKNATYEFQSDRAPKDAMEGFSEDRIHRLNIDPPAFIGEIGKRLEEWGEIQKRLQTPYLCFKLSNKGEDFIPKAPPAVARVLKLLREGRTIESAVKRSCMGRFTVCHAIIKLLDDGMIFPYPATTMPMLASDHRAHKRYADALYIYRRLTENADDHDKREYRHLIEEITETIKTVRSGEEEDDLTAATHREAARRFKRKRLVRRTAMGAFCLVSAVAIALLLAERHRPKAALPDWYKTASKDAEVALVENRYEDAIAIWDKFYAQIDDKGSDVALRVRDRLKSLPGKLESYLADQFNAAERLERAGNLEGAQASYEMLLKEHPSDAVQEKVNARLSGLNAKRAEARANAAEADLQGRLQAARNLLKQKRVVQAREQFESLAAEVPANSEARREIDGVLRTIQANEDHTRATMRAAEKSLAENRGEEAAATFERLYVTWPESEFASSAREQCLQLRSRSQALQDALNRGADAERRGVQLEALRIFRDIDKTYPQFAGVQVARERIAALSSAVGDIEIRLADAHKLYESGAQDEALEAYKDLLRHNQTFLETSGIEIPLRILSEPPGAKLSVDGRDAGMTPALVLRPIGNPIILHVELEGYAPTDRKLATLPPSLETMVPLKRQHIPLQRQDLHAALFAAPRVVDSTLYVLPGTALVAFDAPGKQELWRAGQLLDDSRTLRPGVNGEGSEEFVPDRSWWYPRLAPTVASSGNLIVTLRSREVVEVDAQQHVSRTLVKLPADAVGAAVVQTAALLGQKALLTVGCADGKVRAYKVENPGMPLWARYIDGDGPGAKTAPVTGVAVRNNRTVLTLSAMGRLTDFNLATGDTSWVLDLKSRIAPGTVLPENGSEDLAAVIHFDGRVSLVDVSQRSILWTTATPHAMEEAQAATVTAGGVYTISRDGVVKKFPREKMQSPPDTFWQRELDGPPETALACGKVIFAATNSGTVYALAPSDGRILWNYRIEGKITQLACTDDYVYVCTDGGWLLVLHGE